MSDVGNLGAQAIALLFFSLIFIIGLLGALLWYGRWISKTRGALSPYTKQPMMLGTDMPISIGRQVEEYMKSLKQPENPPFDYTKASICRDTGRIFPNTVRRGEIIHLNWNFLQERYPGSWISWGSLPDMQRGVIKLCHRSLAGFQTEVSSPNPQPESINAHYAMQKPGPLYVYAAKKVLLGWKVVPGTYFEVLIVQKPDYETIEDTL
ncbi:MAG: conserved putative rane protein [Chlamydiia bacterium]|nr:conserved putative rane protein [Chlamydiia bacterium]